MMYAMRQQFEAGLRGVRDEVENLRRAHIASTSGLAPIDVKALENEMDAFMKYKGKGQSGKGSKAKKG